MSWSGCRGCQEVGHHPPDSTSLQGHSAEAVCPCRVSGLSTPSFVSSFLLLPMLARATDEQWCCGRADPGLLEQREEWGQGALLVGCKGDLGLTQGRRSVGAAEKPTGISAAGSQVGQMTLVFHSSLKHRLDLGTGKSSGGKGRQP